MPAIQIVSALGILLKPTMCDLIDMISMLSQIIVKFHLSKCFIIEENKSKVLLCLCGIGNNNNIVEQKTIQQTTFVIEDTSIMS